MTTDRHSDGRQKAGGSEPQRMLPFALCPLPFALCPLPFALCPLPFNYAEVLNRGDHLVAIDRRLIEPSGLAETDCGPRAIQ
jgi:hypothetical protein